MSRMKIGDRKTLIRLLKDGGFVLVDSSKHEKWSNGKSSVYVPHKHGNFSRMLAERIAREAGVL